MFESGGIIKAPKSKDDTPCILTPYEVAFHNEKVLGPSVQTVADFALKRLDRLVFLIDKMGEPSTEFVRMQIIEIRNEISILSQS